METKRAEQMMIPLDAYPHIPYWFTLRQAIVEIENAELDIEGRKSLPRVVLVFDEQYNLMGVVRRRDVLRGLEPQFLAQRAPRSSQDVYTIKIDPNLAELAYDRLVGRIRERAERPVSEVMIPIRTTVEHTDNIMKVIYEMVEQNVSLIPVLKEGRVAGVIRSVDVFHEVAQLVLYGDSGP